MEKTLQIPGFYMNKEVHMFGLYKIEANQKGLVFKDGTLTRIVSCREHRIIDFTGRTEVEIISTQSPYLVHKNIIQIGKSEQISDHALVLNINDNQRGLVWLDGRFYKILGTGLHIIWKDTYTVTSEIITIGTKDEESQEFKHPQREIISNWTCGSDFLQTSIIPAGYGGILYKNGKLQQVLQPGKHLFWKEPANISILMRDLRIQTLDLSGQDIMSADKVTLRINALIEYKIKNLEQAVNAAESPEQVLYKEAQLILREIVGGNNLDELLSKKGNIAETMKRQITSKADRLGLEVMEIGIRDIILPGDMKDLLNKVVEAKKAAEANLITRREETAAMRSQANTAKMLENNPALMRLKELEVLEKVAASTDLKIILGDKKLTEQVVNLI